MQLVDFLVDARSERVDFRVDNLLENVDFPVDGIVEAVDFLVDDALQPADFRVDKRLEVGHLAEDIRVHGVYRGFRLLAVLVEVLRRLLLERLVRHSLLLVSRRDSLLVEALVARLNLRELLCENLAD